jgi:hypothetical protein
VIQNVTDDCDWPFWTWTFCDRTVSSGFVRWYWNLQDVFILTGGSFLVPIRIPAMLTNLKSGGVEKVVHCFCCFCVLWMILEKINIEKDDTHTNQASHPIPTSSQSLTPMSAFHILRLRWQQWGWRQGGGLWGVKSGWPKVWVNQIRKGSFGSPHILAFHYPSEGFCITTF